MSRIFTSTSCFYHPFDFDTGNNAALSFLYGSDSARLLFILVRTKSDTSKSIQNWVILRTVLNH